MKLFLFIISLFPYTVVGFVLGTTGIKISDWQFWAIIASLIITDIIFIIREKIRGIRNLNLYLCGQYRPGNPWEFQGVFSSEQKAIKACRNENYFYAPIELDKEIPDQTEEMPEVIYPMWE